MKWITHEEDGIMPNWLKTELVSHCPTCNSPIENGYNENSECTRRRCTNNQCPDRIAERIGKMCEMMKYAGVKAGIGRQLVFNNKLTSHFGAVPLLFKDKPAITLQELFRYTFIYGIDSEFNQICKDCETVEDVYVNYKGRHLNTLIKHKEEVMYGSQFFTIKSPNKFDAKFTPCVYGCVIIHGEIPNFPNRDNFIPAINNMYKGLVSLGYSKSKRKTGLYCCISEDKNATSGKTSYAKEAGVPVLNAKEFMEYLNNSIIKAGRQEDLVKLMEGGV